MSKTTVRVLYAVLGILSAGATVLIPLLQAGAVPIPKEWLWATPIIVAMLVAFTAKLPKWGHEEIATLADEVGHEPAKQALRQEQFQQIATDKTPEQRRREMDARLSPALRRRDREEV